MLPCTLPRGQHCGDLVVPGQLSWLLTSTAMPLPVLWQQMPGLFSLLPHFAKATMSTPGVSVLFLWGVHPEQGHQASQGHSQSWESLSCCFPLTLDP